MNLAFRAFSQNWVNHLVKYYQNAEYILKIIHTRAAKKTYNTNFSLNYL